MQTIVERDNTTRRQVYQVINKIKTELGMNNSS
jgi:hypothetical protein